jgi:Outer membrane protein beta-barrel domain
MKKIVLVCVAFASVIAVSAQEKKTKSKVDLANRAADHLMVQLSTDYWAGMPDSIKDHKKGLSRGANIYVMLDKPFKNNPRFSAGFGIGFGTSNMYFKNYGINVKSTATKLPFTALDSTDHFKKYKLTTAFLEVPVELRFTDNPENPKKSIKAAIGIKVGTLLNVHTKGKTLLNKSGTTINSYTEKESNKRFFNSTRIAATARVGMGNFSLFGSYQITSLLKDGVGPDMKPFQIGICLSGL